MIRLHFSNCGGFSGRDVFALETALVVSVTLVVWNQNHSRASTDVPDPIYGDIPNRIRSAIYVVPISCSYERDFNGVAAPRR